MFSQKWIKIPKKAWVRGLYKFQFLHHTYSAPPTNAPTGHSTGSVEVEEDVLLGVPPGKHCQPLPHGNLISPEFLSVTHGKAADN